MPVAACRRERGSACRPARGARGASCGPYSLLPLGRLGYFIRYRDFLVAMENPFTVSAESLAGLSEERAEDLVMRMIAAEAESAGIHLDRIYDAGKPSSSDRGVDFEVRDAPRESAGGLIKKGHTLYQVKSGKFSPARDVDAILFKKDGSLRDPVRNCLEGSGTLVVMLTGWGGSNTTESGLEGRFADALHDKLPRAENPVRVWTPARIAVLLGQYPHLALFANSAYPEGLHAHDAWSRFADMSYAFKPGDKEDEFMRRLRDALLDDRSLHVRVTGEPGSGKTRLVLEATRDDRLRGRVIYADGPIFVQRMLNHVSRGGTGGAANSIIVVDDCGRLEQADIWNKAKNSSRIRLVSIHSEKDESRDDMVHMPVPPLADAQLGAIISTYTRTAADAAWIEYCRASPRAAHIVGANLRNNPGDMLRSPSTVAVWDRYIAGQNDPRGGEFRMRKTVLEWLSLFKTFGHGDFYGRELDRIAGLVEKNARVSRDDFMRTIRELRSMKVLQGTSMLYITPKLLHINMWVEWWKNHSPAMAPGSDELADRGEGAGESKNLLQWYLDMFRYARHAPVASKVVKKMLAPGGLLDSDEVLRSQLGADFFLTVSPVDPESSLACIGRVISRADADPSVDLGRAHPNIALALAQMLSHPGTFKGAMRLLLRLAVAAGGADAARAYAPNPPLDAYCNALDPSNGGVSTPPAARLAVLESAAQSDSIEDRRVAVHACAAVLSMHRRSIVLPSCTGFEHMPEPWVPSNRAEVVDYYLGVIGLLGAAARGSGGADIRREAAAAVVDTMHQTLIVPELSQPVAELLGELAASGIVDKAPLLGKITFLLDADSDRIGHTATERMSSLRDSIVGSGFHAEVRLHVGRYARRVPGAERADRAASALGMLADRAVRDGDILADLDWLVTGEAVNGLEFGREVAERDPGLRMLEPILEAMRRAGPSARALFLSGYLQPAAKGRRGDLEDLLDRMLGDADLCRHVPEITWRTGVTDRAVKRVTSGVSARKLGVESLQPLRYGRRLQKASAAAVAALAAAILDKCGRQAGAGEAALGIVHSRFVAGRGDAAAAAPLPERLALGVLLHNDLLGATDDAPPDHVTCSEWKDLAAALAGTGGPAALALAEAMVDRFGDSALLHAPGPEPPSAALAVIAAGRPREVWRMIAARIDPPLDRRALQLLAWIGAGGGSRAVGAERLTTALMPWILAWAEEDPDGRAGRVSRHLPPVFPAIRDFVARFGGREDVRAGLAVRFVAGTYRGSAVSHYADRKKQARRLYEGEGNPNVLSFLDHYVEFLDAHMDREAAAEERLAAGLA